MVQCVPTYTQITIQYFNNTLEKFICNDFKKFYTKERERNNVLGLHVRVITLKSLHIIYKYKF